jgi:DNA-binding NarL/FixJ family response regulator
VIAATVVVCKFETVPTTIAIFEDNNRLRDSLVYILENTDGYRVVAESDNGREAATIVRVYQPDVVLMDIDMPEVNGIEGVRLIKEARPQTAVVMYTVFEDDDRLFQCLCAGANGYLLKKTAPEKLFDALKEVMEGGAPMSPSIARKVLSSFQQSKPSQYHLTQRETDVLGLLTKGYSAKLIAADLDISFDTVRSHLKNIYSKLHVNCGKEAIAKALKEHIV